MKEIIAYVESTGIPVRVKVIAEYPLATIGIAQDRIVRVDNDGWLIKQIDLHQDGFMANLAEQPVSPVEL